MDINLIAPVTPLSLLNQLPHIIEKYSINTEIRLAHFMAQASEESAGFTKLSENLNYSEDGLNKIFPSHFPEGLAKNYARQPEKIANRVYADRYGNGNEDSGDGWKFRGRGAFELTFRDNYRDFGNFVKEDLIINPDLVGTKYFLESAAWYWIKHNLNHVADNGGHDNVINITKIINGGLNGLSARIELFDKFYNLLKPIA